MPMHRVHKSFRGTRGLLKQAKCQAKGRQLFSAELSHLIYKRPWRHTILAADSLCNDNAHA